MVAIGHKRQTRIFRTAILVFVGIVCVIWVIPLILIFSGSITQESVLVNQGYQLIPPKIDLAAYRWLANDPSMLIDAYGVTIFVTFVGTIVSLLIMSMLAFTLARKTFRLRGIFTFFVFFTILFNGGLVPYYINMTRTLGLRDSVFALILPYLVTPFFVLLLRTYFATLPKDLFDAARVDGAGEWRIFFRIAVPLSTPALATVGLFTMLLYWNDMYQALLFIESQQLYPLQFMLYRLIVNSQTLSDLQMQTGQIVPTTSVTMAMAVLAIAPVTVAFLFVQKYFVRGITLGSLKGD